MPMHADANAMLETIGALALQIAQSCPDCAEPAMRIVDLAKQVHGGGLDRGAIRDAVETTTLDSDLSDTQVGATVEAVAKISRNDV
jgi:hypothetical protein